MNIVGTDGVHFESTQQRRILAQVLLLNVLLSAGLVASGIYADSSGLMANALDDASDSAEASAPHRRESAAAYTFSINDFISNLGILVAAGAIKVFLFVTGSNAASSTRSGKCT